MSVELVVDGGKFRLGRVTHIRELSSLYTTEAIPIEELHKNPYFINSLKGEKSEFWLDGRYYARFVVNDIIWNETSRTYTLGVTSTHDGKLRHPRKESISISEYLAGIESEETEEVELDDKIEAVECITQSEHLRNIGLIKTVNVLGTDYEVHLKVPFESDEYLKGCDGYCDYHAKKIVVGDCSKENGYEWADLQAFENKVLRHELAHAFLYESGMNDLARDEKVVDWIAIQFPKLNKVFKEVGVNE